MSVPVVVVEVPVVDVAEVADVGLVGVLPQAAAAAAPAALMRPRASRRVNTRRAAIAAPVNELMMCSFAGTPIVPDRCWDCAARS